VSPASAAAAVVLDDDEDENALMHIVHTLRLCARCLLGFSNNRTITFQHLEIALLHICQTLNRYCI